MNKNRTGDDRSPFLMNALGDTNTPSTSSQAPKANSKTPSPSAPDNTVDNPHQSSMTKRSTAMTDDWRPSDEMVKLILATICANEDYLRAQLISFTSHFHGQYNPNWDQQFKKWINNGWNVYGHKNNFAKTATKDDRDFVEKHTDKSWRDGL